MSYTTSPLTTNSYSELCKTYKNKFKDATFEICNYAIVDIDATLKIRPDLSINDPYVVKLMCERDAALDRKMVLNRKVV